MENIKNNKASVIVESLFKTYEIENLKVLLQIDNDTFTEVKLLLKKKIEYEEKNLKDRFEKSLQELRKIVDVV